MDTPYPEPLPSTLLPRESSAKRWVRRGLLQRGRSDSFAPIGFLLPHIAAGRDKFFFGNWPTLARILVIRPDHIGDVLLITPALRLLRQTFPEAEMCRFSALVGPWSEAVLAENPHIDRIGKR